MEGKKRKGLPIRKVVGYSFIAVYAVAAFVLVIFCIGLNMLPVRYLLILGVILAILAVLFAIMQEKFATGIAADVLSVILAVGCIAGCYYVDKMDTTIREVSTTETETDVVSVYVMQDDPAQVLTDAANYQFGITSNIDRENTDKTIEELQGTLGRTLNITEYDSMFTMLDELRSGTVGAIIMNGAYVGIAADVEGYEWVSTGLREITSVAHDVVTEQTEEESIPEDVPETFIMYLSGIDTYGGISARSRSDVNILAVVNTRTKNILLLSTPRDYYVEFSVTGGAKDKLTHAGIYGVDVSMDALERLYGIDINYYLRVNFTGFIEIIDALGGVEVYSDYDFTVQNVKEYHQGMNQLDGLEALAFARERYSFAEGDFQRAKNQMEVIRAVINKAASSSLLANYNSVMNAVAGSFETNMPQEQIAALVRMQLSDMASWNITSYTSDGTSMYAETFSMPGQQLYVIEPDSNSVAEAKRLISEVYGTDDQSNVSDESGQ